MKKKSTNGRKWKENKWREEELSRKHEKNQRMKNYGKFGKTQKDKFVNIDKQEEGRYKVERFFRWNKKLEEAK